MSEDAEAPARNTSLYLPFYQYIFEAADITSYWWQPLLKSIGRTQLEFAGLQARQTRALVHWSHRVARAMTPADYLAANAQLWETTVEQYVDAAPRVAAAVETATEAVAPPTVHTLPHAMPARDTLILLDRGGTPEPERKVA
ncbi:MAG: hypothetical protein JSR99_07830 [Proteobacteria bacterium]|nr:hypothetical protein [Pseudomonadota bacterium]